MIHVILEVLAYLLAGERTINERTNLDSDLILHESECVGREAGSPFCSQGERELNLLVLLLFRILHPEQKHED